MLNLVELDRLLADSWVVRDRLNRGERLVLDRLIRLRKRHGPAILQRISWDDLESLEDWAAMKAECAAEAQAPERAGAPERFFGDMDFSVFTGITSPRPDPLG